MKSRQHLFLEKSWTIRPSAPGEGLLPVFISHAGYACWPAGRSYTHEYRYNFGMELICSGTADFFQQGQSYQLSAGQLYLLQKGLSCSYCSGKSGFLFKRYLSFEGQGAESLFRMLGLWRKNVLSLFDNKGIAPLFKKACILLKDNPPDVRFQSSVLAYAILLKLTEKSLPSRPPVLERALNFISANLQRNISLEEICHHAGSSPTHLGRLFRQHLNSSVMGYFNKQRLTWAAAMLCHPGTSIKEIAYQAGYSDPYYFSAAFKKEFGLSPKHYRQTPRENSCVSGLMA